MVDIKLRYPGASSGQVARFAVVPLGCIASGWAFEGTTQESAANTA